MRRARLVAQAMVLLAGSAAVTWAGCIKPDTDDCAVYPHAGCGEGAGGQGGGGGTPAGCVPSENTSGVGDECGTFVAANGDDGASGTKAAPVKTIAKAFEIAGAKGKRVYACAEEFGEAVEVPAGTTIFGGLDCANGWAWIGETTKTTVAGPADAIAMKLLGGEGTTRIEDVAVRAADATVAGGSSIAVLVDGATAELARCELTAGNGSEGAEGGDAPSMPPEQAPAGSNGRDACTDLDMMGGPDTTLPGGASVVNDCDGELSIGGNGGPGNVANGGAGSPGETGTLGAAGAGEPAAGAWDCAATGTGQGGSAGTAGDPGVAANGLGTLSSTGYAGVTGGAGTPGKPGQGGGGGGGTKGGNAICAGAPGAGASGGSGGAGGCGGQPGEGGGPGGASIAMANVQATVTLTDCTLTAGKGGMGGPGGDFQPGAVGGTGGTGGTGVGGSKAACAGGQGGQGGNGGPGGGGLGGPSLAVAFTGTAPTKTGTTVLTPGTAGIGGLGGSNNAAMNAGADGTAAEEHELP